MRAYRLVEVKGNEPYSLFHGMPIGNKRTRRFPVGQWLKAERKRVTDGSGQKSYIAGFNILLDLQKMHEYSQRFTQPRDLRLIEIEIKGRCRSKPHSNAGVWLADYMYIPRDWAKHAVPLESFKSDVCP